MKNKLLNIFTFIIVITLMSGIGAPALPNGNGVQKFNPGLDDGSGNFIKGVAVHAIFDFGDQDVKAGSWVTISFGVVSDPMESLDQLDEELQKTRDFVSSFDWVSEFDGVDIVADLLVGRYDQPIVFEDDGFLFVIVRFSYYVPPQSIGCYLYEGSISIGGDVLLSRSSNICWMPGNIR